MKLYEREEERLEGKIRTADTEIKRAKAADSPLPAAPRSSTTITYSPRAGSSSSMRAGVPSTREMGYDVELITVAESPTAVIAATTTWERFPTLWKQLLDQVWAFLRDSDLRTDGHNVMLYKDDVPNVEVGVQVTRPFTPTGSIVPSRLPAGRVTRTVHRGPYDRLDDAHRAVREWCGARGLAIAGPRWEIYGDWRDDPAELETEVCYLLA